MNDAGPTQRQDALRNRHKIVAAAKSVLVTHGFGADMRTIAAAAGVGIGTLYRHFPSREHLIEAILDPDLADLTKIPLPPDLPAAAALRGFLHAIIPPIAANRCVLDMLTQPDPTAPDLDLFLAHLRAIATAALARARHDHTLRPDITAADIAYHVLGLVRIIQLTRAAPPAHWERHIDLVLAGLSSSEYPGH